MENDIKYKSLEAGRRSFGSRGARAPWLPKLLRPASKDFCKINLQK